jgi:hypothetical protein
MLRLAEASLEWRRVDQEVVILNTQTARYLRLNRTAATLWGRLVGGADEAAMVSELVERYGVTIQRARSDVSAFLADLRTHGLLEPEPVGRS